jgi:hypothetical protein
VTLPPELAALAMAFSSVLVVTSSLLLKNFRPRTVPAEALEEAPALEHVLLEVAMEFPPSAPVAAGVSGR